MLTYIAGVNIGLIASKIQIGRAKAGAAYLYLTLQCQKDLFKRCCYLLMILAI